MGHAYLVVGVVTLVGAAVLCWITPNRIDATAGGCCDGRRVGDFRRSGR